MTPVRDVAGQQLDGLIARLTCLDHNPLRFVVVEGDSVDNTWGELLDWQNRDSRVRLVGHPTGKARFGHVVSVERFRHLAGIINAGIEMALADDWADYVMCIPSDVAFDPDLVTRLLKTGKDFVSPMFWTEENNTLRFYDIWAWSRNGMNVGAYNFTWYQTNFPDQLVEMDTVGGCVMMKADLLRAGLRYSETNLDRGLCEQARSMGQVVWADPTTHIVHL